MKLYTEDQVFNLFENFQLHLPFHYELLLKEHINSLTPIELPSDEDICNKAEEIAHNYFDMHNTNHYQGLEEGAKRMAKWMLEQIKEQADGK